MRKEHSVEDLSDFEKFKITTGLFKTEKIFFDEISYYLTFLADKYLNNNITSYPYQREYLINDILYQKNLIKYTEECFAGKSEIEMLDLKKHFFDWIIKDEYKVNEITIEPKSNYFFVLSEKNKRRALEDRYSIVHNLGLLINIKDSILNKTSLYSIFDGHGGVHTSQYLSIFLARYLSNGLYEYIESNKSCSIKEISDECCNLIEKLHELYISRYSEFISGSTITICLKIENTLVFIYLGDSKAYIIQNDGQFILTTENSHELTNEKERHKVICRGGSVDLNDKGDFRLKGRFSLSRSFGNSSLCKYLIQKPDVFIHEITSNDKFIMMGSDGFWDHLLITSVASCYSRVQNEEEAKLCLEGDMDEVLSFENDNATVILVKL